MRQVDTGLAELAFQADSGDSEAQYRMGLVFLLGESVDPDLRAAYRWMARAADAQHSGARSLVENLLLCEGPASDPTQIVEKARIRSAVIVHAAQVAGLAALKKVATLSREQIQKFAAKLHFESGPELAVPTRRSDGFEFPEVS